MQYGQGPPTKFLLISPMLNTFLDALLHNRNNSSNKVQDSFFQGTETSSKGQKIFNFRYPFYWNITPLSFNICISSLRTRPCSSVAWHGGTLEPKNCIENGTVTQFWKSYPVLTCILETFILLLHVEFGAIFYYWIGPPRSGPWIRAASFDNAWRSTFGKPYWLTFGLGVTYVGHVARARRKQKRSKPSF